MSKLLEKIWQEFVAILPPTIFFFVTLGIIAVVRVLMLRGTGIPTASLLQIAIGALILGKAVLIADMLPIVNRYPDKPLAYNVVWKTVIYFLVAVVIHYLESRTCNRNVERSQGPCRCQRETARGNDMAPFLGG